MKNINLVFQRIAAWTIIIVVIFLAAYGAVSLLTPNWDVIDIDHEYVSVGDTLWSLCAPYCPSGMSLQEYVYYVEEFNNDIDAGYLQPGQMIKMPIYEKECFLG